MDERQRVLPWRPSRTRMPIDLAHLSDEALVALCAREDDLALAELYDRYSRVAYGLALRILRDEALAEDAVQEGFLAVWRSAGRFVPERAKASTWILTLVHRRAVDLVRRSERRRTEPIETAPQQIGDRSTRGPGLAPVRTGARPGRPAPAARSATRGARARLLRRVQPVGAGGEARAAARYDQEQDVRRPEPAARPAAGDPEEQRWKPTESTN